MIQPKVELVNFTPDPVEYLFASEKFAKTEGNNPLLVDPKLMGMVRKVGVRKLEEGTLELEDDGSLYIADSCTAYARMSDLLEAMPALAKIEKYEDRWSAYVKEMEDWAIKVARMGIPIAEQVVFNWQISNVTVAWREQLVRSRTNSYWVQSGRITDNSTFHKEGRFNNPFVGKKDIQGPVTLHLDHPSSEPEEKMALRFEVETAAQLFDWIMHVEQQGYAALKDLGARDEDSREMLGNGILHRLSMRTDLRSLMGMLKQRTCFISQSHWGPIVMQIVQELVSKVDPLFHVLGLPPCLAADKSFQRCAYEGMAQERYEGKDPLPVCPMWFSMKKQNLEKSKEELIEAGQWDTNRNKEFADLWKKKGLEV